ncbi:hypothetical protein H2198_001015 [Neophaeococcomyces mojaviensis]|uniref:Uncharacterized protein n=1 Tax=Neophaeococcomyces mojaviensis TaxID=3383035 RepID=A0ACC3AIZ1_9EURO|nr:hypothetical protein H2198_001015 [Knufia sp. JES_112]
MAPHTHIPAPRNTIETYSARPEREPPRNDKGEIVCQHPACSDKNEIFRRPCEWNKHMDKHERPYKCSEPTCEQNPGFTYSGGLLRHMREVHKKGVGPARRPLYCPHANCIRSTGEGFTRRENLEEHLRRRHSYTGHYSPPPESHPSNNEESPDQPRKRRKTVDPESPDGEQINQHSQYPPLSDSRRESVRSELQTMIEEQPYANGSDSELTRDEAIRQLTLARQHIVQQQELIRRQDEQIRRLDGIVKNLPPGANYSTRPPERSFTAPAGSSSSLPAFLQQSDQSRVDETAPNPQTNGSAHVTGSPEEVTVVDPQQQTSDKEVQVTGNGNEPSRRIEIARDLVSERLASKAT